MVVGANASSTGGARSRFAQGPTCQRKLAFRVELSAQGGKAPSAAESGEMTRGWSWNWREDWIFSERRWRPNLAALCAVIARSCDVLIMNGRTGGTCFRGLAGGKLVRDPCPPRQESGVL